MTFSITAKCEKTGQFGIAIATRLPAVGSICTYAKANVGAISSQSFINPYIGINGISYLEEGFSASEVLKRVLDEDLEPELRQVAIVDNNGEAVAFTGDKCDTSKGHITDDNYSVAGNMLLNEETLEVTADYFVNSRELPFVERMLGALEKGQQCGGDKRGQQSAALYIVDTEQYPLFDLRVDEHKSPLKELRRVYSVATEELLPLVKMFPTKVNPSGKFNLEHLRTFGILKDRDEM